MLMETVEKFGAQRWSVIASHLGPVYSVASAGSTTLPEVKKGEWTDRRTG